jgi:hypothetical protein
MEINLFIHIPGTHLDLELYRVKVNVYIIIVLVSQGKIT